jgi:hypothetical protein
MDNQRYLENEIIVLETSVEMAEDLIQTIKEFEHQKRVGNKFVKALQARGYTACLSKNKYYTKLEISRKTKNLTIKWILYTYLGEITERRRLTWDGLKNEIVRNNFQGFLHDKRKQLTDFILEKEGPKELGLLTP